MSYIWRAALWPLHHVVSDLMKGIQVVVCVFFFFKDANSCSNGKKRKNYNQCLHKANGENFQLK